MRFKVQIESQEKKLGDVKFPRDFDEEEEEDDTERVLQDGMESGL